MSSPLSPGTVVAGRYRLDRLLGQGGMGQVWAVTHEVTLRTAALKFLNAPVHLRPDRRRRFLREARAASAVNHPNVVQIHDFFELDDGTPVMLMDLLEGETLGQRLVRERSLPLADAVDILSPVISAVGTAHALGIVHRDLKPDNVFLIGPVGAHTGVCVLDFGIAKLTTRDATDSGGLTDTGTLLGTPSYMSPEQSFGERGVDHRTDVWSIGVMLYEALSGMRPVEGENAGQVLKRLMSEAITPVEVVVPDLPSDVARLVASMLARDPEGRPADLRPVLDLLVPHGGVRVPAFEAAVGERPPMLDSSPTSMRSSPYSVVRAPDPEARTIASDPPSGASRRSMPSVPGLAPGDAPSRPSAPSTPGIPGAVEGAAPSALAATSPAAPARSRLGWAALGIAIAVALGLAYGAVQGRGRAPGTQLDARGTEPGRVAAEGRIAPLPSPSPSPSSPSPSAAHDVPASPGAVATGVVSAAPTRPESLSAGVSSPSSPRRDGTRPAARGAPAASAVGVASAVKPPVPAPRGPGLVDEPPF